MSFAVEVLSRKLQAIGVSHLITANGQIIVEAEYNPKAKVRGFKKLKSFKKVGKTWKAEVIRDDKRMVTNEVYHRELSAAKRKNPEYRAYEKKRAALRAEKTPNPNRSKGGKMGWKRSPILKKKSADAAKSAKKSSKPGKKVVKPVAKKSAKKVVKTGKKRMV